MIINSKTLNDLLTACEAFTKGWGHFCKCVDFNHSNLDADAIKFMNEVPGQIQKALKEIS